MPAPKIIENIDHLSELEAEIIATSSRLCGVSDALDYLTENNARRDAQIQLARVIDDLVHELDVHLRKRFEVKLTTDDLNKIGVVK